jgi:hypothetical protein
MTLLWNRLSLAIRDRQRGHTHHRSPEWAAHRRAWLTLHPTCAACGSGLRPEVHHIFPIHLRPDLELDPCNYITLCESTQQHHLHYGHLSSWNNYNPSVRYDAALHLRLLANPFYPGLSPLSRPVDNPTIPPPPANQTAS